VQKQKRWKRKKKQISSLVFKKWKKRLQEKQQVEVKKRYLGKKKESELKGVFLAPGRLGETNQEEKVVQSQKKIRPKKQPFKT